MQCCEKSLRCGIGVNFIEKLLIPSQSLQRRSCCLKLVQHIHVQKAAAEASTAAFGHSSESTTDREAHVLSDAPMASTLELISRTGRAQNRWGSAILGEVVLSQDSKIDRSDCVPFRLRRTPKSWHNAASNWYWNPSIPSPVPELEPSEAFLVVDCKDQDRSRA